MAEGYTVLILVVVLGLLAKNALIAGAALLLILLKIGQFEPVFPWLMRHGISAGLFLLVLAILAPVAGDGISLRRFAGEVFSVTGLVTIIVSALSTWIGRYGVQLLDSHPQVLVGFVVGSVLGAVFLAGVPTGPLIAAGLTALFLRFLQGQGL